MKALLIDAYDSFVYIIRQYLLEAGLEVPVVRNDRITGDQIEAMAPDLIVLGPGPSTIRSGAIASIWSPVMRSLRTTGTSSPASSRYWRMI